MLFKILFLSKPKPKPKPYQTNKEQQQKQQKTQEKLRRLRAVFWFYTCLHDYIYFGEISLELQQCVWDYSEALWCFQLQKLNM